MGVNAHPMHVVLGLEPNVELDPDLELELERDLHMMDDRIRFA